MQISVWQASKLASQSSAPSDLQASAGARKTIWPTSGSCEAHCFTLNYHHLSGPIWIELAIVWRAPSWRVFGCFASTSIGAGQETGFASRCDIAGQSRSGAGRIAQLAPSSPGGLDPGDWACGAAALGSEGWSWVAVAQARPLLSLDSSRA